MAAAMASVWSPPTGCPCRVQNRRPRNMTTNLIRERARPVHVRHAMFAAARRHPFLRAPWTASGAPQFFAWSFAAVKKHRTWISKILNTCGVCALEWKSITDVICVLWNHQHWATCSEFHFVFFFYFHSVISVFLQARVGMTATTYGHCIELYLFRHTKNSDI